MSIDKAVSPQPPGGDAEGDSQLRRSAGADHQGHPDPHDRSPGHHAGIQGPQIVNGPQLMNPFPCQHLKKKKLKNY